jgi:8-oxo-dGTP diphosphatase
MKITTLAYLVRGEEILLAKKKHGPRGFGVGKWNGVGGKVEAGESITAAAVREIKEEVGVDVLESDLESFGANTFVYKGSPDWDQVVHLFIVKKWKGEPAESDEVIPGWFSQNNLPFENMWPDDIHWLPLVLRGNKIAARFVLDATGDNILSSEIKNF